MDKKGQGLSINTIVVAAIAVVILVVIILIFTGKIGVFNQNVNSCKQNGGQCINPADTCTNGRIMGYSCGKGSNQKCCLSLDKPTDATNNQPSGTTM